MVRRTFRAAQKFANRHTPVEITATDAFDLGRLSGGIPPNAKRRRRLVSMGLATSTVHSKCFITELGQISLDAYKKSPRERDADKVAGEPYGGFVRYNAWLAKHAPPFSRAAP